MTTTRTTTESSDRSASLSGSSPTSRAGVDAPESGQGVGEPPVPPARTPWQRGWWRDRISKISVRTRIVFSVAVLTATALAASGLLVFTLESQRVQMLVYDNIRQEIAELYELQFPRDEDNQRQPAFESTSALLTTFLTRNVPDDDELFVGWWGGEARLSTGHAMGERTTDDPGFTEAVSSLLPDGGSQTRDVAGIGRYLLTVQPLGRTSSSAPDALVIVSYLDAERDELARTMRTYAAVSFVLLLVIVAVAWLQSGRLLRPLRALHASAEEISATDLSRRLPVNSNDDIGQLTRTYNAMLDRLQQGIASQRQFLDDAGHELRTPLTVLRGHLELVDPQDPREVRETADLLVDEVDRMSRLVDELILLAKSDRPDFVRRTPVGVADLIEQVHRKASALDADRDWRIGELPPRSTRVMVDEQRITQALLQLCDNAVKHTVPGDRITLASTATGSRLLMSVTDTGLGVRPEARERIFERFGRAHVPEGDEGFGLGLSIVKAIADAHDADVRVENGPGRGARFVLDLPMREGSGAWPES